MGVNPPYSKYVTYRWALEINSTNQDFHIQTSGDGQITITIPTGIYFHHKESQLFGSYPSIAKTLENELNSQTSHTYTVSYTDPTNGSWGSSNTTGLEIKMSSSTNNTDILFQNSSFTFPPEYIGWSKDRDTNTGLDDTHTSPFTVYGMWTNGTDGSKLSDFRRKKKSIQATSDSGDRSYSLKWDDPTVRENIIFHVKSPFIYPDRSTAQSNVDGTDLGLDDENCGLEDMWRDVNSPDGTDSGLIIVTYNNDAGVSSFFDQEWDVVRLEDGRQRKRFFGGMVLEDKEYSEEFYTVNFQTRVILDGDDADSIQGYLSGDYVARLLSHWHDPSTELYLDDFRDGGNNTWDSPYGSLSSSKNGDPTIVDGISDDDGNALDFDGNDDYVSVSDNHIIDMLDGESFSCFSYHDQPSSIGVNNPGLVTKWDGAPGYRLFYFGSNNDRIRWTTHDGTNSNTPQTSSLNSGIHSVCGTWNDGDVVAELWVDGSNRGGQETSLGSLSNNNDLHVGNDSGQKFPGKIGLSFVHSEWLEGAQISLIDNVLNDRTNRSPSLPVAGNASSGLSRELPDRVDSNSVYWWNSRNHYYGRDASTISQIPDHQGSNFLKQIDSSDQGSIRKRNDEIGNPSDHLSLGTGEWYVIPTPLFNMNNGCTIFLTLDREPTSTTLTIGEWWRSTDSTNLLIESTNQDQVQISVTDSSSTGTISSSVTLSNIYRGASVAFRLDTSNDEVKSYADTAYGSATGAADQNTSLGQYSSFDNARLFNNQSSTQSFSGNVREIQFVSGTMSDSDITDKLSNMSDVHSDFVG